MRELLATTTSEELSGWLIFLEMEVEEYEKRRAESAGGGRAVEALSMDEQLKNAFGVASAAVSAMQKEK